MNTQDQTRYIRIDGQVVAVDSTDLRRWKMPVLPDDTVESWEAEVEELFQEMEREGFEVVAAHDYRHAPGVPLADGRTEHAFRIFHFARKDKWRYVTEDEVRGGVV